MYKLVESVEVMFRLHMEKLLIEGILENNYKFTLLAREKLNLFGVNLKTAGEFNQLLLSHFNLRSFNSSNTKFTKSDEEKNSLQKEFSKLTLKSDKLKDDIAKINKTNQKLSERLSSALAENKRLESLLVISDSDKNKLQTEVTVLRSEPMSAKQLVTDVGRRESDQMSVKQDDNQKLEKRPGRIQPIIRNTSLEGEANFYQISFQLFRGWRQPKLLLIHLIYSAPAKLQPG